MKDQGFSVCNLCGDRIGVYEPTVVLGESGRASVTSRASDRDVGENGEVLMHAECFHRTPGPDQEHLG